MHPNRYSKHQQMSEAVRYARRWGQHVVAREQVATHEGFRRVHTNRPNLAAGWRRAFGTVTPRRTPARSPPLPSANYSLIKTLQGRTISGISRANLTDKSAGGKGICCSVFHLCGISNECQGALEPSPAVTEQTGAESRIPRSSEPFGVRNQARVGVSGPWQETQRFPKQAGGGELAPRTEPDSEPGNSLQWGARA